MLKAKLSYKSGFVFLTLVAPFNGQAIAQALAASPSASTREGVEEIVVTAQKRSENLQKVPIAVTAITGAALDRNQVKDIQGLANSLPNVQINSFSNSPDSAVFTIRGIGVSDADPYVGTTVSVVVDGVPVGVNTSALLSLFDVDRVEVLRGPQGTLFGANTTGGVINVITKQPTGVFGGEGEIIYGNYNRLDLNAAVNFPITDGLSGKISVLHTQSDGFFRAFQTNQRLGRKNLTIIRPYLKYSSANYTATLIGEYDRSRNGSQPGVFVAGPHDLFYNPVETSSQITFKRGESGDQPDTNDRDSYSGTLTQTLDTEIGKIVAISAYRQYSNDLYSDDDGQTAVLLETHRVGAQHQFTQEVRLQSDITDRLQVTSGAFYLDQAYHIDARAKLDGFLRGLSQIATQRQSNMSISGFAQTYYKLTDNFRLQAGLRYSHEHTNATSTSASGFNPIAGAFSTYQDPAISGSMVDVSGAKSWDNVGYKFGADWQFNPDALLYGYYAHGFKSGGFTGRIAVAQDLGPFNPEFVNTAEIGLKSELFDRRLRLNMAAFLNRYHDMQVTQDVEYLNGTNSASIRNAGGSKTQGVEIEAEALPVRWLTLTGSLAYLDAHYTKYDTLTLSPTGVLIPVSFAGNPLMNAPKWSGSVGFSANQQFAVGKFVWSGQYTYASSKYTNYTDYPQELVNAIGLVNATVTWSPDHGSWSIGLWARNLLNNKYYAQKLYDLGIGTLAELGNPREFGLDVKVRW